MGDRQRVLRGLRLRGPAADQALRLLQDCPDEYFGNVTGELLPWVRGRVGDLRGELAGCSVPEIPPAYADKEHIRAKAAREMAERRRAQREVCHRNEERERTAWRQEERRRRKPWEAERAKAETALVHYRAVAEDNARARVMVDGALVPVGAAIRQCEADLSRIERQLDIGDPPRAKAQRWARMQAQRQRLMGEVGELMRYADHAEARDRAIAERRRLLELIEAGEAVERRLS